MTLGFIKCPRCHEISPLYTPYPKCYYCQHTQYLEVSKVEKENQSKVEEMVKHLLPSGTPACQYPEVSISPLGNDCYGWSNGNTNTVSIPRNTLYMARKHIADTTAHECAHVVPEVWQEHQAKGTSHEPGSLWEKQNEKFQTEIFNHFSSWINRPNPNIKYLKNYYKKHPEYSLVAGDLLYDPYEDD